MGRPEDATADGTPEHAPVPARAAGEEIADRVLSTLSGDRLDAWLRWAADDGEWSEWCLDAREAALSAIERRRGR